MKTITIGEKFDKCDFRETCFGIAVNNGKILLVDEKRNFSLVGGGIEQGEDFSSCLKREFLEESGYAVKNITELVCIDCYWVTNYGDKMNSKANIFIVEVDLENVAKNTEEKCTPVWVDLLSAKDMLALPYHKAAIDYYLKGENL